MPTRGTKVTKRKKTLVEKQLAKARKISRVLAEDSEGSAGVEEEVDQDLDVMAAESMAQLGDGSARGWFVFCFLRLADVYVDWSIPAPDGVWRWWKNCWWEGKYGKWWRQEWKCEWTQVWTTRLPAPTPTVNTVAQ